MNTPSELHYVVLPTRVGRVFVVMSCDGVVDVVLDEPTATPSNRFRLLTSRFPGTRLIPGDGAYRSWAAAVVARIDGTLTEVVAPVDLSWSALLSPAPAADTAVVTAECVRAS